MRKMLSILREGRIQDADDMLVLHLRDLDTAARLAIGASPPPPPLRPANAIMAVALREVCHRFGNPAVLAALVDELDAALALEHAV